jgi:uncharacterized protein YndB with AHSA1/START domain
MTVTVPDHAPLRQAEEGCLAMADISGYTAYLAGSELDHAQDVLADLTETVVNALAPPMRLSKLEGDAAFVYAPGVQIDASMLLDTVEATYFAFRRRQDAIDRATSCECNACVLIPRLDLKFVAHHGRFVRQRVAGSEELSGSDVIVVHRLLKNTVAESLGHAAYAFYTDSMVAAMSVSPEVLGWQRHGEEVADIGPVQGWVADLHAAWAAERERRRVKISPEESRLTFAMDLPAARPVVWQYLTDPVLRPQWQAGTLRVDQKVADGRRGTGTTNHCVHGKAASLEEVLDWRPFDYYTIQTSIPAPMLAPVRMTMELAETPGGTRLTHYIVPGPGAGQSLLFRAIRGEFRRRMADGMSGLVELLAQTPSAAPATRSG